ncbi:MAG TPA: hypothetical protein VK186_02560 [Candidatus Deferrimicrobium sp.]|nr:hypothetical protein [Candidatus Deferrimicrobium sp.]
MGEHIGSPLHKLIGNPSNLPDGPGIFHSVWADLCVCPNLKIFFIIIIRIPSTAADGLMLLLILLKMGYNMYHMKKRYLLLLLIIVIIYIQQF